MVNLELYRVFYMVAKCGSLTKAAQELFISQPAVSQAIKQLETQLGGKLFNRVSRGMQLTKEGGEQMYAVVSAAIEQLDRAENEFSKMKSRASGNVRISASDNITTYSLMKYITEFHEMYPDVTLTFTNATTAQTIQNIKDNKADIGFVNLPINDKTVCFTGQTGKLHDVFVAGNEFSVLKNREIDLSAIINYPVLLLDGTTTSRREFDKFMNTLSIKVIPEFEVSTVSLLIEMAKRGMGIACVPREYVKEELKNGELFALSVNPQIPTRATGVILNRNMSYSFAVAEFLKLLNKYEKIR